MGKQRRRTLPKQVRDALVPLESLLAQYAEDGDRPATEDLVDALQGAIAAAAVLGQPTPERVDFDDYGQLVARRIKRGREAKKLTQAEVAERMTLAGFDWKRITVAEVEAATRRVSLDELLVLASDVLEVPMVNLMLAADDEILWIRGGKRALDGKRLRAKVMGGAK
jgi:transcriptional regulator with XRE-family HTH domain